ncbi:MAG: hypothetical protein MRY79_06785 [Alphaproteobacteria bacterium]|nr:hypothetical protein [Alphaproteobacteria bacterium]
MKTQTGNALWFILIAIGLMGLLTVMLSRGSNTTNDTGDYEQTQIAASQILGYAKSLENAVQMLLARGCSENEISFENSTIAGYTNANAPTDNSCHVFEPEGAGMEWEDFDSTNANMVTGSITVTGLYTTEPELILSQGRISESQCAQINRSVGLSATAPTDTAVGTPVQFTGSFSSVAEFGDNETTLAGRESFCISYGHATDRYYFYHVLNPR